MTTTPGITDDVGLTLRERRLPKRANGGWAHDFFCSDHAAELVFDPDQPDAIRCPVDGGIVTGERIGSAWLGRYATFLTERIRTCARHFLAAGDLESAAYCVEVLREWARLYVDLPLVSYRVGAGRVFGQSLEEAMWAVGIVEVYDAVRETLSPEVDAELKEFLRTVASVVRSQLMGQIHNIECWHLSALVCLGSASGDADIVTAAVEGELGLLAQFEAGIRDDGWWAEGSPTYHFFMLKPALAACAAARTTHPELAASARVRSMVAAPLGMMRPDRSLPAFNDGWADVSEPGGLDQFAPLFDQAHALWGTPRLVDPAPRIDVHPDSGYAVLADPAGDPLHRTVVVKYGPHGGWHGHFDKLSIDVHCAGVRLSPDLGSPAYSSPLLHPWIRQTLSHNTALVGGLAQPPGQGRLLSYASVSAETVGLVDVSVDWRPRAAADGPALVEMGGAVPPEYARTAMRRTLLVPPTSRGRYLVDVVTVTQDPDDARPVDLAFRHRGVADVNGPAGNLGNATPPYDLVTDVVDLPAGAWSVGWLLEGLETRLWGVDPVEGRSWLASCPGLSLVDRQSLCLRRAPGASVTFLAVLEIDRAGELSVTGVGAERIGDGWRVTVQGSRPDVWLLDQTTGSYELTR